VVSGEWVAGWSVGRLISWLVSGYGFRVTGFGFRVSGYGFRDSSFGFRVTGFGKQSCAGRNSEVAKRPPLPLRLALRTFQPIHNGLSRVFYCWGYPPDPQTGIQRSVLYGCGYVVRSMGEAVAEPLLTAVGVDITAPLPQGCFRFLESGVGEKGRRMHGVLPPALRATPLSEGGC
jgi:hypothetical protein